MTQQIPITQIKRHGQTFFSKEVVNRFDQKSILARKSSNIVPVPPPSIVSMGFL